MCGIVGYVGKRQAYPFLLEGLRRLEYRGYDSAGLALMNKKLQLYKTQGKVADLEKLVGRKKPQGTVGIGHTRWATHGVPNDINAHPHLSCDGHLALVHNGILENYAQLKEKLSLRGHNFVSETDTEVLVHLIEEFVHKVGLVEAVRLALNEVVGAYAVAVISRAEPDLLVAARKSSPLVVGIGQEEFFLASDASPIAPLTQKVVYLEDEEIAVLQKNQPLRLLTLKNKKKTPEVLKLELELEALEKGGFDHFMLKEIYEQPKAIEDCLRGRLDSTTGRVRLGGLREQLPLLSKASRITFVACGTSWHAALEGKRMIEDLVQIPVSVEYASEFRYKTPLINKDDVVIAVSQSGETADTLAAVELAKSRGALVLGICNVVGSSIARVTDAGSYTHAGPEIGVASTKAFTAQITVLSLLALLLAQEKKTLTKTQLHKLTLELSQIPRKVSEALKLNLKIKRLAKKHMQARDMLYLGRGYSFPVALEGALKLKELSYIHAEGLPAGEMKHGPIALIDDSVPVVVVATKAKNLEKILSNVAEVKARQGQVIALVNKGTKVADADLITVPATEEIFSPLITSVPLQLLAYHMAVLRGCNVDQPRNLAKSVTVE